ncbi:MAG: hypothetical protein VX822_03735 [Candidatus Neomarinimicrobiota bacterium]|nr:hypothetical protein [Candidatus Neomarinimicrobiota bacterium]
MSLKKFSIFLTLLCLGTWVLFAMILKRYAMEIFLGMAVPLIVGIGTLIKLKAIFERSPEKLTAFMTKAFGTKMVFYGFYLAVIVGFSAFNERPFLVSFIVYFVALHMLEALFIRSVFKGSKARNEGSGRG